MTPEFLNRYEYRGGRLYNLRTGKLADTSLTGAYRVVRWDRGTGGVQREYAHRLVWALHYGDPGQALVDHIDRDTTNNNIDNLRLVDKSGNSQNASCKGYWFNKGKWMAYIKLHGARHYLGRYETEDAARAAYLQAKAELHSVAGPTVLI